MTADDRPSSSPPSLVDDLRGATRLAIEATRSVAEIVEAMHLTIAGGPDTLGRPAEGAARLFTRPIFESIHGVARLVGKGIDATLAGLEPLVAPLLRDGTPGQEREAVVAALNGVLGDYLAATDNPLAIEMRLRRGARPLQLEREALRLAIPEATSKLLVLVHGSCLDDRQWTRQGHDHGAALEKDLGFTPMYLRYNTGLHTSVNGRALAALLEELVAAWPQPIDELVCIAHSMGGLVARSACHLGEQAGHRWRRELGKLVFLGTPHDGAPLERGGHWVDLLLGVSRYSAPLARLGRMRSAGVTDLRFGNVLDEHWQGRDRFAHTEPRRAPLPLPDGVACYAIAATKAPDGGAGRGGDGLVPVASALGRSGDGALALEFPEAHQWIAHGTNHLDLLCQAEVYTKLRSWLGS